MDDGKWKMDHLIGYNYLNGFYKLQWLNENNANLTDKSLLSIILTEV